MLRRNELVAAVGDILRHAVPVATTRLDLAHEIVDTIARLTQQQPTPNVTREQVTAHVVALHKEVA